MAELRFSVAWTKGSRPEISPLARDEVSSLTASKGASFLPDQYNNHQHSSCSKVFAPLSLAAGIEAAGMTVEDVKGAELSLLLQPFQID